MTSCALCFTTIFLILTDYVFFLIYALEGQKKVARGKRFLQYPWLNEKPLRAPEGRRKASINALFYKISRDPPGRKW